MSNDQHTNVERSDSRWLEDLRAWGKRQGVAIRSGGTWVEVCGYAGSSEPILRRTGASAGEAAFYVINCLHWLGVEVAAVHPMAAPPVFRSRTQAVSQKENPDNQ